MSQRFPEPVRGFRDLRVWRQGMDLVDEVYRITEQLPRNEVCGLASQLRKAAVSVPSNIAEGHVREHIKEYLNHLSMAQASLAEAETKIEIAVRLKYIPKEVSQALLEKSASLAKQIHALRNSLMASVRP